MDGSPQVVRFDVTTLWHFDAAEWAPSTASIATERSSPRCRRMSASRRKRTTGQNSRQVRLVPILLQKALMASAKSDSVAQMRSAAEASDDGAAQPRPRTAILFILS